MTVVRECALLIFERLGIGPLPESYLKDLERLNDAAGEWSKLHPQLPLCFDVPELAGGAVVFGNLPLAIELGWARNEAAKSFVRYIDERSGGRASLLQLQVLLTIQEAVRPNRVNAPGGLS